MQPRISKEQLIERANIISVALSSWLLEKLANPEVITMISKIQLAKKDPGYKPEALPTEIKEARNRWYIELVSMLSNLQLAWIAVHLNSYKALIKFGTTPTNWQALEPEAQISALNHPKLQDRKEVLETADGDNRIVALMDNETHMDSTGAMRTIRSVANTAIRTLEEGNDTLVLSIEDSA